MWLQKLPPVKFPKSQNLERYKALQSGNYRSAAILFGENWPQSTEVDIEPSFNLKTIFSTFFKTTKQ